MRARAAAEGEKILKNLDAYVTAQMLAIGVGEREVLADPARTPMEIKRAMPRDDAKLFCSGGMPKRGFGLIGGVGVGKSMAMSGFLRAHLTHRLAEKVKGRGEVQVDWVKWVSWPIFAGWLRSGAVERAGEVREALETLSMLPGLILDDLGAERMRGSYQEDYARAELDLLIDRRYRKMLPTWFTSNLMQVEDLEQAYGARMVRRLFAQSEPVYLPSDLPNLDLQRS